MDRHPRIIRIAGLVLLGMVVLRTTADVDLWGHVLFGSDIVHSSQIPASDLYSFTSDREWVNHEWLAEVLMYLSFGVGGPAGLVLLRLIVIGLVGTFVWLSARCAGLSSARADIFAVLGVILTMPRTQHVRPQLFSVLCCALLLYILKRFENGDRRSFLFVPLLMVAWVNLHGGWIVGAGVLGIWTVFQVIRSDTASSSRTQIASVAALAAIGTLLNPYGAGLWRFLWETVGIGRSDIVEWWPITSALPGTLALWLVTAGLSIIGVIRPTGRRRWSHIAIASGLGVLSYRVERLDAFFALAVLMLLQPTLSRVRSGASAAPTPSRRFAFAGIWVLVTAMGILALGPGNSPTCIEMERVQFLPEPEALRYIQEHGLRGRMLSFFDWGEYAIWHLAPDIKVSMDGRRETVYSAAEIERHLRIYDGRASDAEITTLRADLAWLPGASPAVDQLVRLGWRAIFSGPRSVILSQEDLGFPSLVVSESTAQTRCFPGP